MVKRDVDFEIKRSGKVGNIFKDLYVNDGWLYPKLIRQRIPLTCFLIDTQRQIYHG